MVFGVRAVAVGVKVATVFAVFMATVPGTLFPVVSLSVNVSSFPAGAEFIVTGSIGWSKVAVTTVPLTTLLLLLVLVGTFVAFVLGLEETSVGAPVTTVLFASVLEFADPPSAPPPHPATKAVSNNAISHVSGLNKRSNLFIFFLSSFESVRYRLMADSLRCAPRMHCIKVSQLTYFTIKANPQSGFFR